MDFKASLHCTNNVGDNGNRVVAIRRTERLMENQDLVLTPAEIQRIDDSQLFKDAKESLARVAEGEGLPAGSYRDILVYLIFHLVLENGQRSGAVINMTMDELKRHKRDGDISTIAVLGHKTSYKGPAIMGVNRELLGHLMIYMQHMRPTGNTGVRNLFLKQNTGLQFAQSELNELLNSRLEQILGRRINCTIIRRTVVNRVWEANPDAVGDLARHTSHSTKTAEGYYALPLARRSAVTVSRQISRAVRAQPSTSTGGVTPSGKESGLTATESESEEEETQVTRELGSARMSTSTIPLPGMEADSTTQPAVSSRSSHGRRAFIEADLGVLLASMHKHIQLGLRPTFAEITTFLEGNERAKYLLTRYTLQQLVDRVVYVIRKKKQAAAGPMTGKGKGKGKGKKSRD